MSSPSSCTRSRTERALVLVAAVTGVATITASSEGQTGSSPQPGRAATIILQDGFEKPTLSRWEQIPANGRYSITSDPRRVKSGAHSMQALYTPTNTYGMLATWFMPGYDEVYIKFHVLFEEGFENLRADSHGMHFFALAGNRIDNTRSSFGKAGVKPDGTDFFYVGVDPEYVRGDPTLRPFSYYTYWPDMSCCYGNAFVQSSPKAALIGGQWQEVVVHVKLNTPGQGNGSQTLWINGVKKIDVQNVRWRATADLRLNQIRFDNYMPGAQKTQRVWVDDVTVWRP